MPAGAAGQPCELSGNPFKTQNSKQQQQQQHEGDPSAAAAAAGPKRFSDDTPSGPDVAASPATGWAEVYGGGLEDTPAAAAEAAAADGDGSPAAAAAASAEGVAAAAAAGGDAAAGQEAGETPFFFMDAYEAPERPGGCGGLFACMCFVCVGESKQRLCVQLPSACACCLACASFRLHSIAGN
jgi:hypothetical protein